MFTVKLVCVISDIKIKFVVGNCNNYNYFCQQ